MFDDFYSRNLCVLTKYANQTISVVMAIYTLKNRKPSEIIRLDSMRLRVKADGSIDENHQMEGTSLTLEKVHGGFARSTVAVSNGATVIDAKGKFKERQWQQRHPKLSQALVTKIYAALFS
ncbi:MAG: hypothetical protein A3H44_10525 [Gammaproteobacteria bacterium RIFCSPLOWO2_02_FULL_57_10]|nr:MAG: hypothetical protein A3H44_10525 [Gammaproteobacteria bacterium RIFCSPLOWO2_02_FULL_57_10]